MYNNNNRNVGPNEERGALCESAAETNIDWTRYTIAIRFAINFGGFLLPKGELAILMKSTG